MPASPTTGESLISSSRPRPRKLVYVGGGDYLIGVPARDLEGDEVGEDWMVLVLSGLYMEERAEYQEVLPEPTEGVSGDGDNQTN